MAASAWPGRRTVWPPMVLSYWFQTQARLHRSGQAIRRQQCGAEADRVGDGPSGGCFGVSAIGR